MFPGGTQAVDSLDLEIADGEFMVARRPVRVGQDDRAADRRGARGGDERRDLDRRRVVNDFPPMDRDIAMVFQSYALYPHMTVYENMAFALKMQGLGKREIEPRVHAAATHAGDRRAAEAEAGDSFRAASASGSRWAGRSCASREAFLMDEPLSNLDAKLRVEMRAYIATLHQRSADDDALRHARPDRGDDDGRPRRGHARRSARSRSTRRSGSTTIPSTCSSPASSARRR